MALEKKGEKIAHRLGVQVLGFSATTRYGNHALNSVASAFPVAYCGVSERILNDIFP